MRKLIAVAGVVSVLLAGCSSTGDVSGATQGAGEDWTATPKSESLPNFPHSDYTFTYSYSSQAVQYTATVTVEDGGVVSVEFEDPTRFSDEDNMERLYRQWADRSTMDFIIEDIRNAKESGDVEVVWRENRDHPESAKLDPMPSGIDDESSWTILDVEVDATPSST